MPFASSRPLLALLVCVWYGLVEQVLTRLAKGPQIHLSRESCKLSAQVSLYTVFPPPPLAEQGW